MERNLRKNNAITLVALVITIIVLLILAGVGIATLTQTGLFENAKQAKSLTENAQNLENEVLQSYENKIENTLAEKKPEPKIEQIWKENNSNTNYSYLVPETGKYIVGIMNSNYEGKAGKITATNSKELISKSINIRTTYNRCSTIKIIQANAGSTIKVEGYNSYCLTTAFIFKIDNIDVTEVIDCNISSDTTAQKVYKCSEKDEKILAISFANGASRSVLTKLPTEKSSLVNVSDSDYFIGYITLKENEDITMKAYGYNWGGGSNFILK